MAGRGKGNKGLGAYHPSVSIGDAKTLFSKVIAKKYHKLPLDDFNVVWCVDKIFGNDEDRSEAREFLKTTWRLPTEIKFMKVDDNRPLFDKARHNFIIQKKARRTWKTVMKELEDDLTVAYRPGLGRLYQQVLQDFQRLRTERSTRR